MKQVKTIAALWAMARPLIMLSVFLVYIAGVLIARAYDFEFDWETFWWGFAALLLIALSTHYANEYADYETDAITDPTMYSGGSGAIKNLGVPRVLALQAAWASLILGIIVSAIGLALDTLNPAALLMLGIIAVFGWMYSLPPLKLAWRGWGELDNAILGGVVLHLYGFAIVSREVTLEVALITVPFTMLNFTNLLATTWADREADAQVGKNTLATFVPVPRLRALYTAVVIGAYALLLILALTVLPVEVALGSLLAIPLLIWGWFTYTRIHNPYPTSNAMVLLLLGQMVAWYIVGS